MRLPFDDQLLLDLLAALDTAGHAFVPPTPATHARVVSRADCSRARDLAGVFGWSLPFDPRGLRHPALEAAWAAGLLEPAGEGLVKATVRSARVHGRLFLHSAYPTDAEDSVFLGPDTYRFSDFVLAEMARRSSPARIVDVGAGAGVGGVLAGLARPQARVTLCDVNAKALRLARVNAAFAGLEVEVVASDGLASVQGALDLVLANPPFIMDDGARTYRDGGALHGAALSLRWALEAADRLAVGGALLLYTGAAIVAGEDVFRRELSRGLEGRGLSLRYREVDPDIFGEELERPAYADVDRIAAVTAVVERPG